MVFRVETTVVPSFKEERPQDLQSQHAELKKAYQALATTPEIESDIFPRQDFAGIRRVFF